MPSDQELAKVATEEPHRLEKFLKGLTPDDWSHPSACDGWLVADVVAHLEANGHSLVDRIGRGLKGDSSEPSDNVPAGSISEDQFLELIATRAITLKEQLGDTLLPALIQWNRQMDEVITGLKPQDWDARCYHSMGPEPVRTFITMRIAETAMHSWDIRSSFDPKAAVSSDCLSALIKTIPRAVRRAFRPNSNLAQPVRYRFETTGPVTSKADVVLGKDGARFELDAVEKPGVTFRCGADTYVMVMFGRMKMGDATAQGLLAVEGPQDLAGQFAEAFVGG